MSGFKNFWNGSSWGGALFYFLGGGCVAFIWAYIFSATGNPIHIILFLFFLGFSIYYLVKFVRLVRGKGKKQLP
jgi:hypothetical protein